MPVDGAPPTTLVVASVSPTSAGAGAGFIVNVVVFVMPPWGADSVVDVVALTADVAIASITGCSRSNEWLVR